MYTCTNLQSIAPSHPFVDTAFVVSPPQQDELWKRTQTVATSTPPAHPPSAPFPTHVRLTLLPQVWLALLHCSQHQVTRTGGREAVQPAPDALHSDDVEILGSRVIGTVHNCPHGETQGYPELRPRRSLLSCVLGELYVKLAALTIVLAWRLSPRCQCV